MCPYLLTFGELLFVFIGWLGGVVMAASYPALLYEYGRLYLLIDTCVYTFSFLSTFTR